MKLISLISIIIFLEISNEETTINFIFPRTIYIKKDLKRKVIKISSSEIKKEDSRDIKLYISNLNSTDTNEKYIQCGNINDSSNFYCILTINGTYDFKYKVNDEKFINLEEKIYVFNSINEIFYYSSSRDTDCYYNKESFSYLLFI